MTASTSSGGRANFSFHFWSHVGVTSPSRGGRAVSTPGPMRRPRLWRTLNRVETGFVRTLTATTRLWDWLLMTSLLLLTLFEIWIEPIFQTGMPGPRLALTLLATVTLAPLLVRRAFPLAALTVMCLGMVAVAIVGDSDQSTFVLLLGLLVGTYSLSAYATPRDAVIGAMVMAVATIAFAALTFAGKMLVDELVPGLFLAGAWTAGKETQRQRKRALDAAEHSRLSVRAHQLEVAGALAAERSRIARELHDVVAHAISIMGIQAGAARRTLEAGQTEQHDALLDVERLGREALEEMQRMLAVLRTSGDEQYLSPLPDLAQLPALADVTRRAGVDVVLDMTDELDHLAPSMQLAAYRIVQEGLTNVRKHAEASRVHIRITCCNPDLEVIVADDGIGVSEEPAVGNGLIGMRERVAIHQGSLYVGPGDGQGFLVRATFPVQSAK